MSTVPEDLRYTSSHEWVRSNDDGSVTVGITDHAQEMLGDMVYIELPAAGRELTAGSECAVVESVKAASDVYAPVDGKVVAVNDKLGDAPELVNQDPYGDGWMFRLEPADAGQIDGLLDAAGYSAVENDD